MSNKKNNNNNKKYSVNDLISKASDALNKLQPDLASKFYQKALEIEPSNTNLMDALADVQLQLGQTYEALDLLTKSTTIAPNENPYKWMFLAQLQNGINALESYNKGITLLNLSMTNDLDVINDVEKVRFYKKQISKAFCSIAELYLTDLCYEDEAETKCEEAIIKAMTIDTTSLDAQQAMANLRFSQNRSLEACNIMEIVYGKVKESIDKVNARTIIDEITSNEDDNFDDSLEPEFCIATAKLLIECAAVNSIFAEYAITLISDLLLHDDENIELWYMMGVAALGSKPVDVEVAKNHLEHAKMMIEDIKMEAERCNEEFSYEEQYILIIEHLKILEDYTLERNEDENNEDNMKLEEGDDNILEEDEEWSTCDENENEDED